MKVCLEPGCPMTADGLDLPVATDPERDDDRIPYSEWARRRAAYWRAEAALYRRKAEAAQGLANRLLRSADEGRRP